MRILTNKIPSLNEIPDIINRGTSTRTRALASLLYLTACRISEILKVVKQTDIIRDKADIEEELDWRIGEKNIILVKTGNKKHKRTRTKTQIINLDRPIERELWGNVDDYIDEIGEREILFPHNRDWAHKLLRKEYNIFPHLLRHFRLSHISGKYDLTEQQLVLFAGWTDGRPAKTYVHLRARDLLRKL